MYTPPHYAMVYCRELIGQHPQDEEGAEERNDAEDLDGADEPARGLHANPWAIWPAS